GSGPAGPWCPGEFLRRGDDPATGPGHPGDQDGSSSVPGRLLLQRLRASRRGAPGDPRARGSVPHRAGEADDRGPGPGDGGSDPSRPASVASRGSQLAFRSMRVGLVCPYDLSAPGGVQQLVLELAERLRGVGHEAVVVGAGDRKSTRLNSSHVITSY